MHLQLRDVQPADLERLFQFQDDPEANAMADFPARDRNAFFDHWHKNILRNDDIAAKAIIVNNEVVGSLVLWSSDNQWLLGYWVGREYWGKGYASNGLRLFLSEHTQRPIHAEVTENNIGSITVLKNNGFDDFGLVEQAESEHPLLAFVLNK